MADKKPSTSGAPTAGAGLKPVKEVNPHDVLLGRGSGSNQWIGNRYFRDIVKQRREEYISAKKNRRKKEIAKELFDCIRDSGGRFLRLDENAEPVDSIVKEGTWYECDEKASLEKCKQALRQHRPDASQRQPTVEEVNKAFDGDVDLAGSQSIPDGTSSNGVSASSFGMHGGMVVGPPLLNMSLSALPPLVLPFLSPIMTGSSALSAALDRRLLLFQRESFAIYPYDTQFCQGFSSLIPMQALLETGRLPSNAQPDYSSSDIAALTVAQQQHVSVTSPNQGHTVPPDNVEGGDNDVAMGVASTPTGDLPAVTEDDEISEYLLSVLALSGRKKFTEEQDMWEKANTTDEEKARVLCDLFGTYCSTRQNKKARRDLSNDEVTFLVKQMRFQIDRIPDDKKDALVKARVKCRADEFSDARLERFLRCEGMDVKVRLSVFLYYYSHCLFTHG